MDSVGAPGHVRVDGALQVPTFELGRFWRALPGFQWRVGMRSWAYTLARDAAHRHRHSAERRRIHLELFGDAPVLELLAAPFRATVIEQHVPSPWASDDVT